jgi:tetratricopeptide (TPR) repeat protein
VIFGLSLEAKREKAYKEGDWDRVIAVAQKQLESEPNDVKALNDLAGAYFEKGLHKQAFDTCLDIQNLCPIKDSPRQLSELGTRYMRHHLVLAELYYLRGNFDEALKFCTQLKSLKGHFSGKFHIAAQIYLARGDPDRAVQDYEKLAELRHDRTDRSIKGLQAVIVKYPRHKKAHKALLALLKKQGQLKQVLDEAERAVAQGTVQPSQLYQLGYAYQEQGQEPKALELFRAYAQTHQADPEVHWHLAELLVEKGNLPEALQVYRQIVNKSPDKLTAVVSRLETLLRVAWEQTKPLILKEILDYKLRAGDLGALKNWLEPLLPDLRSNLELLAGLEQRLAAACASYIDTGDADRTKPLLDILVKINPNNPAYRAQLDSLSEMLVHKRVPELEERLRAGLLNEAQTLEALSELVNLYIKIGETGDKLIGALQQLARTQSPYQVGALLNLGLIFLQKGMADLADSQFAKLLGAPLSAEQQVYYAYEIALAYEQVGRTDKAREHYKRVLEVDANYKDVAQRLARLPALPAAMPAGAAAAEAAQPDAWLVALRERYDEIEEIGGGGMGSVFRAVDRVLRRPVALKFMKDEMQGDQEAVARFIREARSASQLHHPGIVAIYDIQVKPPIYIAMEYIEGGSLRDSLKNGRLSVAQVKTIALQLCDALGYAHRNSVVHRDIKPDNILLVKNAGIKIVDFGLARAQEASTALTRAGQAMGTPRYMAPEQIRGQATDARTDIYSVGVMLYELLTGKVPFEEGDIAYQHIHETPMRLSLLDPAIPLKLDAAVMKCLEKRPEDRFPTMAALGLEIQAS